MAVTLGTVKTTILNAANRDSATYGTKVQNSILTAIRFMEAEHPYIFEKVGTVTITQASGANSVSLPSDLNTLRYVYYNLVNASGATTIYGQFQGFIEIPFQDLIAMVSSTGQTGNSEVYSLFAGQLYVFPFPASDTTYTLFYNYKDMNYPAVDTDSSIWFGNFTLDAIISKASADFYRYALQAPDIADKYEMDFMRFVQNLQSRNNQLTNNNLLSI